MNARTQSNVVNGRPVASQGAASQPATASPETARPAVTPPAQPAAPVVVPAFNEAPSSINLRFDYKGYESIQLTLRDVSGAQLLDKLNAVIDRLDKMGATPTTNGRRPGGQPAPAGESSDRDAAPVCKYHGPMKPSKKPGAFYCPAKMGDGTYCKETA